MMNKTLLTSCTLAVLSLMTSVATAQQGEADPCMEPGCGAPIAYECMSDADCPEWATCDEYQMCVERPLVCFSDYDCLQGEVCVVPDAFARPEPDMCYCANDACTECGMPAMEGSCQIQQAWCGDELCEPGFECQSIIAPCLPGAECAPASQQCVPTTSECLSDAECLEGWSCQQPEGDGSRCAALVAPTEGDQAMPAERCAGPAISVCVPDGGGATCDGAVCNVFTGEEGTPNSDRNDGCTVSVASTPSPASALLLLFGIGLAAIRRR